MTHAYPYIPNAICYSIRTCSIIIFTDDGFRKPGPSASEFCSEQLFSNNRLCHAIRVRIQRLFLVAGVLPLDSPEAKLHNLAIEVDSFAYLHGNNS